MNKEITLPHRITLLGQALAPVSENYHYHIQKKRPSARDDTLAGIDIVASSLSDYVHALTCLSPRFQDLMKTVIRNESATDAEVYRAAGRLEQVLDQFITAYQCLLAARTDNDNKEARRLLIRIYRHTLKQVDVWLIDLVASLADPLAALVKRNLPTTGNVELPLVLDLTSAPELATLQALFANYTEQPYAPTRPEPQKQSLGLLNTICALFLGWSAAGALFNSDRSK